eukprot:NODE_4647_length_781_cov_28.397541_g4303_i0.p1 GENE.NODE_4647_length_781_cov_28.397541_g4303_i0~~NODE_4647_length_781_cov_28.397541_g4303_i0.p1  ORF type:complete len:100 (+),score=12.55 NODE_4647_length_781_cov_28.397541_g4303_i0:100-399(+)
MQQLIPQPSHLPYHVSSFQFEHPRPVAGIALDPIMDARTPLPSRPQTVAVPESVRALVPAIMRSNRRLRDAPATIEQAFFDSIEFDREFREIATAMYRL